MTSLKHAQNFHNQASHLGYGKAKLDIPPVLLMTSEIRKHYFLDRYVIIAPKRNLRPDSFSKSSQPERVKATSASFVSDISILDIKGIDDDIKVRVVNNTFSALSLDNPYAFGKQEVVVDTSDFKINFSELPVEQIMLIFEAYSIRTKALLGLSGIKYVVVFKNCGPRAGATISHPHSQIIALPFIPPNVELEAEAYDKYLAKHSTSPFQDILKWEIEQDERIIYQDDYMVALSPYSVREAFGVWIIPKHQRASFGDLNQNERYSLANMLKKLTMRLDAANIDYNYFLQDSIPGRTHHFHLKLEPRPNIWAGFELSTGVIINPISPEYAVDWYLSKI